jgi:acetyl/propionyl-CoA carboxylase alpha subunit
VTAPLFKKILVANRGVAAVRIMRTCRELDIPTVAVYSDADRGSGHLTRASASVHIGPAPASKSYLVIDKLVDVALRTGCQAVHPGYGFLAESWRFARACREADLVFVGPSAEVLALTEDKIACRNQISAADVPVVPGSATAVTSAEQALAELERTGLPAILKPARGGGGIGTHIVRERAALASSLQLVTTQAAALFGDPAVLMERYVPEARHIEIQVVGDHHGGMLHLHERECSLQRHHQKVVEEAPSPNLTPEQRERVTALALRAARVLGYESAGTVEFLFDGERFLFMEINPRLQVEHGVSEMVTGVDVVRLQLEIAAGKRLDLRQSDVQARGYALEVRVYAEDPLTRLPSAGVVDVLRVPHAHGLRVDTFVEAGTTLSTHYDPMIMLLMAHADNKLIATRKLRNALSDLVINGTARTNIPLLRRILAEPRFLEGDYHTEFLTRKFFEYAGSEPAALRRAAAAALAVRQRSSAQRPLRPVERSGWKGPGWRTNP